MPVGSLLALNTVHQTQSCRLHNHNESIDPTNYCSIVILQHDDLVPEGLQTINT